ncbi:unnamed protein product [Brassicogethes aeneus]|uniref:Tesmin/TSO1-like CXC domain-containing protein n=1 Tax=Brassicogethes aeneus TaxID=1431903 RepID=A0A9P0FJU8_BRAAE|nr:unnamed protein product [Brassicogethes aeneus]
MSEYCFICAKLLTESEVVTVERGMKTLINASIERADEFSEYLKNQKSVRIHENCRKNYTRKSSIAAANKRQRKEQEASTSTASPPRTRSRLTDSAFCFKKLCLFCGQELNEEYEKRKSSDFRRRISQVSTLQFKDSILEVARTRDDAIAKAVLARIEFEYDLVVAEAKYHHDCYVFFLKPSSGAKIGRPKDEAANLAMEEIFTYIENSDDCQFTLNELQNVCKTTTLDNRTIKLRLKLKYGDKLIITEKSGASTFICLVDNHHDVLNEAWYEKKKMNKKEERFRVLDAAAAIIREDIQTAVFDNSNYPPPGRMFEDLNNEIPESLTYFVERVILKNKRSNLDHLKLKCTNICHSIMTAVRPRSFKSKLQLGLAVFFHRRFGSKRLIQIFSSFGLCASYNDTIMYEAAAVFHRPPHVLPPETGTLIQYVADNADINVNTLDGNNTLHIMGIIQIVTPKNSVLLEEPLPRIKEALSANYFQAKAHVPIQMYQNNCVVGYSKINVKDFVYGTETVSFLKKADVVWFYGKWKNASLLGWNGFIERLTNNYMNYSKSQISFLPFIHQPASNYNTIYTTLLCALENAKRYGHTVCIVTFDQPLYAKAREIVSAAPEGSEESKIIIRLGGFHLLMSFLGAIGHIMQGSGIKEVLAEIYAVKSLEKMLNGHAYARAVRAHTLLQLTLAIIILKEVEINDIMDADLIINIEHILDNTLSYNDIENDDEVSAALLNKLNQKLKTYEERGPTAKLWIQYFHMVSIAKEFLRAERMGDWKAHLNCVKEMLPYFHASGHFPYAKSAHLYLQDMQQLQNLIDPEVYEKFSKGFFTVRRSDKLSCGTSTDMVIEQSMMKAMKTDGGIARGRSTKESVISKWVYSMHAMNTVCEKLEDLANVRMDTTEQHVDASDSRIKKDAKDKRKLLEWFSTHDPFPEVNKIVSIASGIVGDDKINCYKAREVGLASMAKMTGLTFNNIKLKRADKVVPLLAMTSTIKVHEEKVPVDPVLLFQRMSITAAFQDEIEKYFEYELAPYPLSLFDDIGMRKTQKSAIYDCFENVNIDINHTNATYIIDGGYLLHRVVWDSEETFNVILDKYVQYVRRHFGSTVTVVFDGYNDCTRNIKAAEQRRRTLATSSSSDILFDELMTVPTTQQKFLTNTHNKNTKSKKQVQLSCLPPTSVAAHQHLFRVYYQVQVWLGYQLDPTDWGWKLVNNTLEPVQTLLPPAPDKLLNTIFCNCKKGCSAKCGCKKIGLFCSLACTNCEGRSCSNVESPTVEDSFDSNEPATSITSRDVNAELINYAGYRLLNLLLDGWNQSFEYLRITRDDFSLALLVLNSATL